MPGKMALRLAMAVGLTAVVAGLSGCSKSGSAPGYPVKGKVTYKGKPPPVTNASTALVVFTPYAKKGNESKHEARGTINEQGDYELKSDLQGQDGIPAGWYQVGVVVQKKDPKHEYGAPVWLIPRKYAMPPDSGILLEVKRDARPGEYDIAIGP